MEQENRERQNTAQPDAARQKPDSARARSYRRVGMIALAVVMVCAAVLSVCSMRNESLRRAVNFTYTGTLQQDSVYPMQIDEKQQKEKVRETKRHGQTGKFRYFCNTILTFDYPFAYGSIVFGNVASNDCVLVFSIYDEAGTLVYRSQGIEPGSYVSQIRLLHAFGAGVHTCRMYVTAYDRESYACIGTQYSDLSLQIGG